MLRVQPSLITRLKGVKSQAELFEMIQGAIKLEHSTIPPYLAALYSLFPGSNGQVAQIIQSIAREEMLHMTIASNLLIALGGKPCFSKEDFIPTYPGTLPLNADDSLVVGLYPVSKSLIYDTFMRIEVPLEPLVLPVTGGGYSEYPAPEAGTYPTIGTFYAALVDKLKSMPVTWGQVDQQVTPETTGSTWFRPDDWFPITDLESAVRAINVIVSEGEGSTTEPVDNDGDPAHFYRFGEIYWGYELMGNSTEGWSFTGPAVTFDEAKVFPMAPNAKATDYAVGTRARTLVDQFNQAYMQILLGFDRVFNGQPKELSSTIGLMYQLRILAYEVLNEQNPNNPLQSTGLPFEYVPLVVA